MWVYTGALAQLLDTGHKALMAGVKGLMPYASEPPNFNHSPKSGSRKMTCDAGQTAVCPASKGASYMHQRQLWAIWRRMGDKELAMTLDRY